LLNTNQTSNAQKREGTAYPNQTSGVYNCFSITWHKSMWQISLEEALIHMNVLYGDQITTEMPNDINLMLH